MRLYFIKWRGLSARILEYSEYKRCCWTIIPTEKRYIIMVELQQWTFYYKSGPFHDYKIVDLFFVREVRPNLPNRPGYGPVATINYTTYVITTFAFIPLHLANKIASAYYAVN